MLDWLLRWLTQAHPARGADTREAPEGALDEPVVLPLDGVLDLHTFHPSETKELVREYVLACQAQGVLALRLIHGKGKGQLRRTVHGVLENMPEVVASYRLAPPERGGWGATLVDLKPRE